MRKLFLKKCLHIISFDWDKKTFFLNILQYSLETPLLESLFKKVTDPKVCIFVKKRTPTQLFSPEYWKIFKTTYLEKNLQIAAF